MNPSASGWIDKFGSLVKSHNGSYTTFQNLFEDLKKTGFVYGINTGYPSFITPEHTFSEDEKAKINLLTALYFTFKIENSESDFELFLKNIFEFYETLEVNKLSFLGKLFSGNKTSSKLEKILESRVYLEDNIISKTFNSFITNSLLFIDVLLFRKYLLNAKGIKKHAQKLEYLSINITYHALSSKEKNKKDEKLAQLLASSLTFINSDSQRFDDSYRQQLINNKDEWENRYLLDLACLTVWEDHSLEYIESEFIYNIGKDLKLDEQTIQDSLSHVSYFITSNKETIPFLQEHNMAVQFYDSMSKLVNRLILRNRKRLHKELSESAELVSLLSKSTIRDLSKEEKKKVQSQLLDIFKSIPSLAIFLLPGGAILLPIFIKLIPKLLPSAFDENRVEKGE
ncbi:LETM1-related biofilm-associated protein [Maribacter sp. PR1]|uniref:LETM1-related biofilm-associated protein n=1 Tax=Maribacter cobaltidurans TaxID=1178778 RepID=A0ABU7IV07_9FLAO|nr:MULTISPECIES: LETM1-related biofilm-associated protein [Maribacter]MDC6389423.1 LETM1-related biofilm-associated protein [Maribacter sp. PR1]MEE1976812.1 LETM1-related biofilm-associated protein [Maribacter cobaltidurans]